MSGKKAGRAVSAQPSFQLTEDQAYRLLEFKNGQLVSIDSVVEELKHIQQARPQWVNIAKLNVYNVGLVVRVMTTRLGLYAARRAIRRCREILRKEQEAAAQDRVRHGEGRNAALAEAEAEGGAS